MTVAGITPLAVVEPRTVDELALCVRELYARDRSFAFTGGGTELELGNQPHSLDTLVKTTRCNRVLEYAPQDQTVSVEAGMTIAEVNGVLAQERQFLAIDTLGAEAATIGGTIATNFYGPRRLRYGSIKDTIVGVDFVRPDGTRARGGGKVVKNVAGFDMPKLMVGSLGTLGAIVSATFRVYPIEEASAALLYRDVSVAQMMQIADELVIEALVPSSVVGYDCPGSDRYDCRVSFDGFARGVDQQLQTAKAIAVRLGLNAEEGVGIVPDSGARRERAARRDCAWHLTLSARPTALARFLESALLQEWPRAVYPLLGVAFVGAELLDVATIAQWRAMLAGGSVIVNAMPDTVRAGVDSWGDPLPPATLAIMRRIKSNFDPKRLCNAGRFIGGL